MNKPAFDPNQPFEPSKPPFDPNQKFESTDTTFAQNREAIEPGVMGETEPVEQKLLNNINAAGAGYSLPNTIAAGAKILTSGADTLGKYAGQFAEKQMGKMHGTTPIMFRQTAAGQLENPKFSQAMRDSYAAGDANLLRGSIGRKESIAQRVKDLGAKVGEIRTKASVAGPVRSGKSMAEEIRKPLAEKFVPGGENFEQQKEFERQLANLEKMPETTPVNFAERATAINKAENKGLGQAKNVETAIANKMSRVNDTDIASRLTPEEMATYELAKQKFGSAKSLVPAEIRSEGKELTTKLPDTMFGAAKHIGHALIGGPKLGAQVGFGAEKAFQGLNTVNKALQGVRPSVGGVTTQLMGLLRDNPAQLGRYATPLLKAAQTGGNQGLAATHYILSTTHPDYNELINNPGQ